MIDRKNLLSDLGNGKYSSLYMVYGKETYLIEEVEKTIKNITNLDMADFNLSIIDGKELKVADLISSIDTLPFMSEYRVVVVRDAEFLKAKKSLQKEEEEELIKTIGNMPSSTILLFTVLGDIDKRKSIVKAIEKNGVTCEMKNLDDISLLEWCKNKFLENKIEVRVSEITYFIELSGYRDKKSVKTLSDLENEIKKICSFVSDEKVVTREVIEELSSTKSENDIFLLLDMISSKNSKRALKIFEDMIGDGESTLGILAMLSRQIGLITQVKYFRDQKSQDTYICDTLNIRQYVLNKLGKSVQKFNISTLIELQNYIAESDYKIKQGKIDERLAMEILIFNFCK